MNVAEIVAAYAKENVELPFNIYLDLIPDADEDSACVRHDSAAYAERRFTDGTRLVQVQLSIFIRCKDAKVALESAKTVIETLDGSRVDSGGTKIDLEALTLPQFVEVDAAGYTIYSATITCTYYDDTAA